MDTIDNQQFSDWARRMRNSDELALQELFDATFEVYVRYAWRFTKNKDSAMDIVQESFIKLWDYRQKLDPSLSLKTYIYRTVKNKALNHLRDKRQDNVSLDEVNLADNETDGAGSAQIFALREALNEWIDELPERQKEAFKLSRFEGLTHDEIADVMEVSDRTVNNHIVAALKTLHKQYKIYKDGKRKKSL